MLVYLNGNMVPPEQAQLGVDDAGLQHAVGLFETMAAYHGRVFRLQAHLDRLTQSAASLGLARDIDTNTLADAVAVTIEQNELQRARIRLTVTAGPISLLADHQAQPPGPTILVSATPPTEYDPGYFDDGVMVLVGPQAANPFDPLAGHKTLSYWSRLRTLRQAADAGAAEVIWLNISNHLAGGAVSNLFLVKDGKLLTPYARGEEVAGALPAPVLPGITRAAVIEIAQSHDITVGRRMLSISDLLEADELFLTNSSWQVLPVTRVEKQSIGNGRVGPLTTKLRSELLDLIDRETSRPQKPGA